MKNINTANASREVRKIRKGVERELNRQKKKHNLPDNLRVWTVERTDWGPNHGNTKWIVFLGAGSICYRGEHKTSVLKALQKAIEDYEIEKRKETQTERKDNE